MPKRLRCVDYKTELNQMITTVIHPLLTLNMKSFIILALVAVAAADVSHIVRSPEADAKILGQDADVLPDKYQYKFETSNGISAQESGNLNGDALQVAGSNAYTSPEGVSIGLQYTADEFGFHPSGAHLPTPPPPQPIPDYILRSIEYIRAHPAPEEKYVVRA